MTNERTNTRANEDNPSKGVMNPIHAYETCWLVLYALQLLFNVAILIFVRLYSPRDFSFAARNKSRDRLETTEGESSGVATLRDSRKWTTVFSVLYSLCRVIEFIIRISTDMWIRHDQDSSSDVNGWFRFLYAMFFSLPLLFVFLMVTSVINSLMIVVDFVSLAFQDEISIINPKYTKFACSVGNTMCTITTILLPILAGSAKRSAETTIGATAYLMMALFNYLTGIASLYFAAKIFQGRKDVPDTFELCHKIMKEMGICLVVFSLMNTVYGGISSYQASVLYEGGNKIQVYEYPTRYQGLWVLYFFRALEYIPTTLFTFLLAKRHLRISQEISKRVASSNI